MGDLVSSNCIFLLENEMGRSNPSSTTFKMTALVEKLDASFSRIKGFLKSGCASTGAEAIKDLTFSNAAC